MSFKTDLIEHVKQNKDFILDILFGDLMSFSHGFYNYMKHPRDTWAWLETGRYVKDIFEGYDFYNEDMACVYVRSKIVHLYLVVGIVSLHPDPSKTNIPPHRILELTQSTISPMAYIKYCEDLNIVFLAPDPDDEIQVVSLSDKHWDYSHAKS